MAKLSREAFHTKDLANAGIKLKLYTPTGEETEEWLLVRGIDSDAYKEAEADGFRRLRELAKELDDIPDEKAKELRRADIATKSDVLLRRTAALVAAWSWEDECTLDKLLVWLRKSPQIAEQIEEVAKDRAAFFTLAAKSSTSGPPGTSDSADASRNPSPP